MKFESKKAKRELIWIKIALIGCSGAGKSYSAFRMATGMKEEMEALGTPTKILVGNTESSRGYYYASEFDYDIVDIPQDANPEDYADFINYAVENNYKIVIIDSASHEWKKALKIHQDSGGDFKAFAKVTPRHDKFVNAIADSCAHIITTVRADDKYEMEKNESGKTIVKKIGLGGEQRKDWEFQHTVTLMLDQKTNFAEAEKDNTHLFEDRGSFQITENEGKALIKWANSGEGYSSHTGIKNVDNTIVETQANVVKLCKTLGGSSNEDLMTVLKKYHSSGNPKRIEDKEQLELLLAELNSMNNSTPTDSTN